MPLFKYEPQFGSEKTETLTAAWLSQSSNDGARGLSSNSERRRASANYEQVLYSQIVVEGCEAIAIIQGMGHERPPGQESHIATAPP